MSRCPYETLPGLDGRAVSYTGGGTPSVHRHPSPNLSPEPREIELVQISEASRKERPQVLIPSLGEGTRRQKPPFACRRSRCAPKVLRFSIGTVPGRFSLWVLVQVHFLDPYKHFRPFLLAPVHEWDLYKHCDSFWDRLKSRFPGEFR